MRNKGIYIDSLKRPLQIIHFDYKEKKSLARLNRQEQEELELAIALCESERSETGRILLSLVNHTGFFLNTEVLCSTYQYISHEHVNAKGLRFLYM